MQVGALEETIIVTGAAPLVDTQNVRKQTVLSSELLNALPTSAKGQNTIVTLTLGLNGVADTAGSYTPALGGAFHGKAGTKVQLDGMSMQNMQGAGLTGYQINPGTVQEIAVQTAGISAESTADGVVVNSIPKEGGNTFSGSVFGLYTNDKLGSDNLTDALRARGLTTTTKTLKIYDQQFNLGGRIVRDKLWFFTSLRENGNASQYSGSFRNKTQGSPFYIPDPSPPSNRVQWYESLALRLTWQASRKNKFTAFVDVQDACLCGFANASMIGNPLEALDFWHFRPQGLYQGTWTSPVTSRFLLEAGASAAISHSDRFLPAGVTMDTVSITDQASGLTYNAMPSYQFNTYNHRTSQRFAASYVTGTHAFKAGFQVEEGFRYSAIGVTGGDVNYRFNNGVPNQITQRASPYYTLDKMKADVGIFAQDQWTLGRLTLNYGLRFEYFNAYVPAQYVAPTVNGWIPERKFAEVRGVPLWKDISPRLGGAYDLFDDGKTAIKLSIGNYVAKTGVDLTNLINPITTSVNSVTRTWTDTNANYVPDCALANFGANGECGAVSDSNFGKVSINTVYADDVTRGYGARRSTHDGPSLQRLLRTWRARFGTGERVFGNLVAGKKAQLSGSTKMPHSFSYIEDVGLAAAALGTHDKALGQVWIAPQGELLDAIKARDVVDLVEDGQREDLANPWHRAEPMKRVGIVAFRFPDDRELEVGDARIVLVDQRDVDRDALLHTRIGKVLHDSLAISAIGELPPEDGQVVLRARVLDVGQELATLAHEMQAPTE